MKKVLPRLERASGFEVDMVNGFPNTDSSGILPPVAKQRLAKADRRAQLLEVAAQLFAWSSFGGVSTAALAKAAGISEPVLYQHFRNKDDLYQQVLLDGRAKTLLAWRQIRDAQPTHLDGVLAIVRQQFDQTNPLWTHYRLHLRAICESHDPRVAAILKESNEVYHQFLRSYLADVQEAGQLDENVAVADLAWLMISQGLMANFCRQIGLDSPEESGYLNRLLRQAMGAVKLS